MIGEEVKNVEAGVSEAEVIEWLKNRAIILKSTTPQEDQSDLNPLREIVGSSLPYT